MPKLTNFSLWVIGSTTASTSSWICLSRPPMSEYSSVGRSSTSIALTLESYSCGSVSRMRYESLLTPTRSPGRSFSASTSPMTGRK
uniref:Putative secreted protein n=1 Tax=Ixodes ricinus TaxID=34613 RepID=A0A6B0TYJ3_IXORI